MSEPDELASGPSQPDAMDVLQADEVFDAAVSRSNDEELARDEPDEQEDLDPPRDGTGALLRDEDEEQQLLELDRGLLEEAERYEIPYNQWKAWSLKERGMAKGRRHSGWKRTARRFGLDEEAFCMLNRQGREEAVRLATERVMAKKRNGSRQPAEPPPPPKVYSPFDDVPPPEDDPRLRDGHTIGLVEPEEESSVDRGDWQVRNLSDACSYYHLGDGLHRIRVERKEPKIYQGVRVGGFVGWITEKMTEDEFGLIYGGSAFELIVYGPDPKGRHDPNTGRPIEKALTKPFPLSIAGYDPVLGYPGEEEPMNSSGPWQGHGGGGFVGRRPMTTAEASIHKNESDLTRELMRDLRTENRELRGGGGRANDGVVQEIARQARELTEQAMRAANDKEAALTAQLAERTKEIAELRKLLQDSTVSTGALSTQIATLTVEKKVMEEALAASRNRHQEELGRLSSLRSEEIQHTKTRHDEELKREKDRLDEFSRKRSSEVEETDRKRKSEIDETERKFKAELESVEKRADQKIKDLKDEMSAAQKRASEEITEVRKRASEEIADVRRSEEKRLEQRVTDLKEHHERELRQAQEHHSHILGVAKVQHEGVLANVNERMERIKSELEDAEEKAAEAGDPSLAIEKFKEQAGKMGFEEKEGPKTAWERFAVMAGSGVGKALEDLPKWLPEVTRNIRGEASAAGVRQLPPGARPAVAQPRQARAPGVAYIRNQQQGHGTPERPEPKPPVPKPPAPAPAPPPAVAEPQQPPAAQAETAPEPEPVEQAAPDGEAVLAQLRSGFGDEAITEFRSQVEKWIENDGEPADFAAGFAAQFPEQAKGFASTLRARDLLAAVRVMPNVEESQILRPNGRKWVEQMMKALRKAVVT